MIARSMTLVLVPLLALASAARAEVAHTPGGFAYCQGELRESVTRFVGAIVGVEPLAAHQGTATPVDFDPRFAVAIEVTRVASDPDGLLRPGQTRWFAIHSPSRSMLEAGAIRDLDLGSLACAGTPWKLTRLEAHSDVPKVFEGDLEVGYRYRAEIAFEKGAGWSLVRSMDVPMHHGHGLTWTNASDFPGLENRGANLILVFDVVTREVAQMDERRWLTEYALAIVDVEGPAL